MVYYGSQDVHTTHRVSEYVLLVGVTVAGNPHDLPAMYAAVATDRSGHVGLIRPAIHSPGGVTLVNLLRTDTDQKWINSQSRLPVYQTVHWCVSYNGCRTWAYETCRYWEGRSPVCQKKISVVVQPYICLLFYSTPQCSVLATAIPSAGLVYNPSWNSYAEAQLPAAVCIRVLRAICSMMFGGILVVCKNWCILCQPFCYILQGTTTSLFCT